MVVAAFTSRYFCTLIIFACAWSSSLSLDLPRELPRLPKYLLDRYSLYPRSIDSSDYIPSYFLYVIIHSEYLLLIYSFSDVSMSWNRVQDPLYQFGFLSPHIGCIKKQTNRVNMRKMWSTWTFLKFKNQNRTDPYLTQLYKKNDDIMAMVFGQRVIIFEKGSAIYICGQFYFGP